MGKDKKLMFAHQKEYGHQKARITVSLDDDQHIVYWCDVNGCNKFYKSLGLLNLHKKAHTKPFKCLCGKSFGRNSDLKEHKKALHGIGNARIICTFFKETFGSTS